MVYDVYNLFLIMMGHDLDSSINGQTKDSKELI